MSDTLPVVLIDTPNGPARLNESDFDPAKHKLWQPDVKRDPLDHDGDQRKGGSLPADVPAGPLSRDDVLALSGGNFMTFKAAAKTLLGDSTPSKKADIITALEALPE